MHHSLGSWKTTLLYFFSWNFKWFGQKEPIKMQILDFLVVTWKFTNFLLLLYFDIFYFFTFNLKKNWFVVSKLTTIWWILKWVFEILKIFTWICSFCAKYITFDKYKTRGVIFHDTKERCKIWRNADLLFGKWREEYDKSSPVHVKVLKLGLWWDPRKVKKLWAWNLQSSYVSWQWRMMQNLKKNWLVTDMRNLTDFEPSKSPKHLHFNELLLNKLYNIWTKKVQRSYVRWLLCFQKWHEELGKFSQAEK